MSARPQPPPLRLPTAASSAAESDAMIKTTNTLDARADYGGGFELDDDQNYAFDVAGVLHMPGLLDSSQLQLLNASLDSSAGMAMQQTHLLDLPAPHRDPFRDLLVHPQIVATLNQLIGFGYRLNLQPQLLSDATCDTAAPLQGGNEPRNPARAYYWQNGKRYCQSVHLLFTLADINASDGGFVYLPCTHRTNVPVPQDVRTGADDMGATVQPVLKAGDVLAVAGELIQGMRPWQGSGPQRLLSYEYVGRAAIASAAPSPLGSVAPVPEEHQAFTKEQRASLYKRGYQDTFPAPALRTDGRTVELADPGAVEHPSVYRFDPEAGNIDHKEFWFWETYGYLIINGVMDEEWLAAANAAVDAHESDIQVGQDTSNGSARLAGTGRPSLGGLLSWPEPEAELFRRTIAHPAIQHRVQWMSGSGSVGGGGSIFASVVGTSGHSLHTNGEPINPPRGYHYQNGRSFCEAVTVNWQLRDVLPDRGGFACVPGSECLNATSNFHHRLL